MFISENMKDGNIRKQWGTTTANPFYISGWLNCLFTNVMEHESYSFSSGACVFCYWWWFYVLDGWIETETEDREKEGWWRWKEDMRGEREVEGLTAGADVALVAVEEAVSDPDVRPRGRVAQLSLTHPTLEREAHTGRRFVSGNSPFSACMLCVFTVATGNRRLATG